MINATPHPHRAQGNNHTKTTHHQPAVSNPGKHPPHRRGSEAGITKQTTPNPKKKGLRAKWHHKLGTLLSSQETDTHHPDPATRTKSGMGRRLTLLERPSVINLRLT